MARRRNRKSKSGININPAHKGAFTRKGISVSKGLKSKNPKTRAQANFARMAKRGFKPLRSSSKKKSSSSATSKTRGKAHRVRGHTRVTSTGKRVRVRAHRRHAKR